MAGSRPCSTVSSIRRLPLGGAMLRSDIVATQLDEGDIEISGIVNLDYSFVVG